MARVSSKLPQERLQDIRDDLTEMDERKSKIQVKIDELKDKEKSILQEIENEKLIELKDALDSNNITIEEALDLFKSKNSATA